MKKDFAGASLDEEGYDLIRAASADGRFPSSYAQWQQLVAEGEQLLKAAGGEVQRVAINARFFLHWCQLTAVVPCLQALRAFLIVERAEVDQALVEQQNGEDRWKTPGSSSAPSSSLL